ncbi:MAG: response regulator transcription factor [Vampirovibrionales bacterium]|nr:response regulator transcription factor [Vampirovibrionales bacterium]
MTSENASQGRILRVLIVDDQKLVRSALRTTITRLGGPDLRVAGEAEEGREAIALSARLTPDIILMDVGMPILDGIRATETIRRQRPEVKIIMLTSHEADEDILDAFRAGANAYCLKDASPETLITVIRRTAAGESFVDPKIAGILIRKSVSQTETPDLSASRDKPCQGDSDVCTSDMLTERELDVLRLIAAGKNNADIAETLVVSPNTVKTHLKNLYQKLDVDDRTSAALKALRDRII